jgi:oligosaccharide repeat unit polymerase
MKYHINKMNFKPVFLITSIIVLLWTLLVPEGTRENIQILGGVGVFTLVFSIYSWLKLGNNLLSPYLVFLVVLYFFSYSIPMLYAFGVELDDDMDLVGYLDITYQQFYDSCGISLIMLCFFHIGALHAFDKIKRRRISITKDNNQPVRGNVYLKRLNKAGWIVAIASVYFYIKGLANSIIISLLYGYGALYDKPETTAGVLAGLSGMLASMFIPSLICLFVANKDKVLYTLTITFIFIIIIVLGFVTGGRSGSVTLLVLLAILYNSLIHKFSRRAYIVVFTSFILLMPLLSYIANSRTGSDRTLSLHDTDYSSNAFVSAIAEMGGSQSCLIATMRLVPSREPYRYGKSYLYSLTTIVPNLGFWKVHPAVKEAALTKWLPNKLGLTYGTGFSMFAEAYINFGYLCFVMIYLLGFVFARVFGYLDNAISTGDYVIVAAILIFFNDSLGLPRAQTVDVVRTFYYIILPLILYCKRTLRV